MQLIFSSDNLPTLVTTSIFLSGPSPRNADSNTWRHTAIQYLSSINYNGIVFIPIPRNKFYATSEEADWNYDNQIDWEVNARRMCDVEVFWIPRKRPDTLGLTTNVEFGESLPHGKVVYGRPDDADNIRYLDARFTSNLNSRQLHINPFNSLSKTLDCAVNYINSMTQNIRVGYDSTIPLHIWNHIPFQNWLNSQKSMGNDVVEVIPTMSFFIGKTLFSMVAKVKVWVLREQRFKDNEFIVTRFNMSSVCVYAKHPISNEIHVLLVSEFRSPVNNSSNYVLELPGGSSFNPNKNPLEIACAEVLEETGYAIDKSKLRYIGTYQNTNTLSVHTNALYAIECDFADLQMVNGNTAGNADETEQTTAWVLPMSEITSHSAMDNSQIGMIYRAIK